jgi:hypothetical protein
MPDAQTFLLPQRAFMLTYRDQALPTRRAALADSRSHFDSLLESGSEHDFQLAFLGLAGDSMQALEDVGVMCTAFTEGIAGLPAYVAASVYRGREVNNFFNRLHIRPASYFTELCTFEVPLPNPGPEAKPLRVPVHECFAFKPELRPEDKAALLDAERATAKLVREHLVRLGKEWERYRRIFHAYKHGALVINPDDYTTVQDGVEASSFVVWGRKRSEPTPGAHATTPLGVLADDIQAIGHLAIDTARYIIGTRLAIADGFEINDEGASLIETPLHFPWSFWMRSSDLEPGTTDVLAKTFGIVVDPVDPGAS